MSDKFFLLLEIKNKRHLRYFDISVYSRPLAKMFVASLNGLKAKSTECKIEIQCTLYPVRVSDQTKLLPVKTSNILDNCPMSDRYLQV